MLWMHAYAVISTVCVADNTTLSLSPSLHSGMPLRKVRIFSAPTTSDLTTVPLLLTSRLTLSTTSRNTSFFLYLMPSLRHETAFVTAIGGLTATCSKAQKTIWQTRPFCHCLGTRDGVGGLINAAHSLDCAAQEAAGI